jgi:hypothetical protein
MLPLTLQLALRVMTEVKTAVTIGGMTEVMIEATIDTTAAMTVDMVETTTGTVNRSESLAC